MNRRSVGLCVCLLAFAGGCDDDKKKDVAAVSVAPSPAASAPAPSAAPATASAARTAAVPPGATRYVVATGKGAFLIDAPLEKIKGASDEVRGNLDVNPKEIGKSRGAIMVRLSTLKTSTFGDKDKDVAQTEHARNWMEVGNDSSAESRMKYEWAEFTVTSVDAAPSALAEAKDEGGARAIKAKVTGDLTVHGVTSKKTVPVTVSFKGPADAPTELTLKTDEPMAVSLKEHDVKPRDKVGGFLNGALERIGKKIDDKVQVSFETTAKATMPEHP